MSLLPCWRVARYASRQTVFSLTLSLFFAVIHGGLLPYLMVLFGSIFDHFYAFTQDPVATSLPAETVRTINIFIGVTAAFSVVTILQNVLASTASQAFASSLRSALLGAVLGRHAQFFHGEGSADVVHVLSRDIDLIRNAVGERLALSVQLIVSFVASLIFSFTVEWQLPLVMCALIPVVFIVTLLISRFTSGPTAWALHAESAASRVATEALSMIKTVTTFGAQESEARLYDSATTTAYSTAASAALTAATGTAVIVVVVDIMDTIALAFGAQRIRQALLSPGQVFRIVVSISGAANQLTMVAPAFRAFGLGLAAAERVSALLHDPIPDDPVKRDGGIIPDTRNFDANLEFRDVSFSYPTLPTKRHGDASDRKEKKNPKILSGLNLKIDNGKSEALIGTSGGGKSTVIRLVQRLYDADGGQLLFGGIDIRDLNVQWLRSQIGVVSQSPTLFMMSIRDNIALGASLNFSKSEDDGKSCNLTKQAVSEEEIIRCAKIANAHDFIMALPNQYETLVGERGAKLSGGQKQRICIARALVRNPRILILDEATSSLDVKSERLVWQALQRAAVGRTTIIIAHRLSTIRSASNISVLQSGRVVERGNHDTLFSTDGSMYRSIYKDWQESQRKGASQLVEGSSGNSSNGASENDFPADDKVEDEHPKHEQQSQYSRRDDEEDNGSRKTGKEENKRTKKYSLLLNTLRFNKPEWHLILFGLIGAAGIGLTHQMRLFIYSNILRVFLDGARYTEVRDWLLGYIVIGSFSLVGTILQQGVLNLSGERLTKRLRSMTFRKILFQEQGFFDEGGNSTGALSGLLSSEVGQVKDLVGSQLRLYTNFLFLTLSTIGVAFGFNAIVASITIPMLLSCIVINYILGKKSTNLAASALKSGILNMNSIASESVQNALVIRSLGAERSFTARYQSSIAEISSVLLKKAIADSFSLTYCETVSFAVMVVAFEMFEWLSRRRGDGVISVFGSGLAVQYAALAISRLSIFSSEMNVSRASAKRTYAMLDRQSKIPLDRNAGEPLRSMVGAIEFRDVWFSYPTRPHVPVLKGLSMKIAAGQTAAIVGESGHGKSTVLGLILRMYEQSAGSILVDGKRIEELNVADLRKQFGVVSQDTDLFNRSVFDNIAYGKIGLGDGDGSVPITAEEIASAASQANASKFIEKLPNGYDTLVGQRGDVVSGGQRQRISIARSLVRDPSIFILDEATSALDQENERLIQESLERVTASKTVVVVAHRLSTVQNADVIFVVRNGTVLESGTHQELIEKGGAYLDLVRSQLT